MKVKIKIVAEEEDESTQIISMKAITERMKQKGSSKNYGV